MITEECTSFLSSSSAFANNVPAKITDDVVQLLANSAEALEDFATIQTEQDIANFNKKYGVNLVLPSEG